MVSLEEKRINAMREGGPALGKIKIALKDFTQPGTTYEEIEAEAQRLIAEAGYKPSFSTVPGYDWATCVMTNEELCHGIPQDDTVEDGDLVTIDLGLINQGFHLDTTISFGVGEVSPEVRQFLSDGEKILTKAIKQAQPGNSVYQVSRVMQKQLQNRGYGAVHQLIGHGIGEELHMKPDIPCVAYKRSKRDIFEVGQTVAIEVMYTLGNPDLEEAEDGWTYQTVDGSLSAMFEETVLISENGPQVLTKAG